MPTLPKHLKQAFPLLLLYFATAIILVQWNNPPQVALAAVLIPPCVWLSYMDLQKFEIPDGATVLIVLFALGYLWVSARGSIALHMVTGVALTALLWIVGAVYYFRTGEEGLGIGDAKLFGAGGILMGPWKLPELFLLASLGGITAYFLARMTRKNIEAGLPFGPFIAYSIYILSFLDPLFL
ncbi:A24 family peptidase [Aliiroseovarius crassostreae]|uniref:A24 family peptidase n=1 Tax=Aliiroseovarius crassostreae TaxID=154981 RepID=A0A9Q9HG20_9RHOB|nr:A24 family peptidase [Aliiroseovarius crassostreae]UWP96190.1 A24 family peptidase [Aliiroseovarius crassostreae]